MKANKCVYVFICLLVVAPILLAEDYKKEIPVEDAMKAFCVTWINDSDYLLKKNTFYNNGKYKLYWMLTDTEPSFTGTFKIEKAWKDIEGNIWFTTWKTYMGGLRSLNKISNSGTVLEYANYPSDENPPTKIDPLNISYPYRRLVKKKTE